MWTIVLLAISIIVSSSVYVSLDSDAFQDQQALTWRTSNWIRWWRKPIVTPAPLHQIMPTTAPVYTMSPAPVTTSLIRPLPVTPAVHPLPSLAPSRGFSPNYQKQGSFQSVEREISVLYNTGKLIGPDHFNRLSNQLNQVEMRGEASAADINRLKAMLDKLDPGKVKPT